MNKLVLIFSGLALGLSACGNDNGGGGDGGGGCNVEANFASIHDNLLSQNTCARAGCHNGAQASGGLDLAGGADAVFAELTTEATANTSATQAMRVGATADDSFLYVKVSDVTAPGGVMPIGGMIPQCEQDAIRDWINAGGTR